MFICHNLLQEDDEFMIEQVEQPVNEQDEGTKGIEINDISNNSEEKIKKRKRQQGYSLLYKKLNIKIKKMLLTLNGRIYEEKMRKILLRLTWLRVYKSKLMKKFFPKE